MKTSHLQVVKPNYKEPYIVWYKRTMEAQNRAFKEKYSPTRTPARDIITNDDTDE